MTYLIDVATPDDCKAVADNIRPEDAAECLGFSGERPLPGMLRGLLVPGAYTQAVRRGESPKSMETVAVYGLLPVGARTAWVWLLASKGVETNRVGALRTAIQIIKYDPILRHFRRLRCVSDDRNRLHTKFLRAMGFCPTEEKTVAGKPIPPNFTIYQRIQSV